MLNLSWNKIASSPHGSPSLTYLLINSSCGGAVAGWLRYPSSAQTPILLDKSHPLTALIVMDAHWRVMHSGIKESLTNLRSAYWLIQGRQFVCKVIHSYLTCCKLEGTPFQSVPSPSLLEYRVWPFCYTGVDFAGPLYMSNSLWCLWKERCGFTFTHAVLQELFTLI